MWKLDYLRFFWNYLVINYVFERKCILVSFMWFWHHAMCDFPVITQFGFNSLYDNEIKFRLVLFHFGWRVLPYCPWGEEVDALSLLPMGGEKNLKGMGEATVHGAKSLHIKEDNIMPVVNGWIPWPVYAVVW